MYCRREERAGVPREGIKGISLHVITSQRLDTSETFEYMRVRKYIERQIQTYAKFYSVIKGINETMSPESLVTGLVVRTIQGYLVEAMKDKYVNRNVVCKFMQVLF